MSAIWPRVVAVLMGVMVSSSVGALGVFLDRPTYLEAALGEVEVVARVESREPVRSVALVVDGRPQAILDSPPFRWIVDVGERNEEHSFKVVAIGQSGERAEAVVETPRLQVDDRLDLELQQLYVTVGGEGGAERNMTRSQFAIEDRGEPQQVVTFERGDIPLTAVILLDVSASMSGAELEMALSSSRAFVDGLQPLDQTMLLMFSDHIIRSTAFTGFKEVLAAALSQVTATGATALNDYLYVGLKRLERQQGRRVVILLSDGVDSASALEMEDVFQYSERNPSLVYWLRLPTPGARISSAWRDADGYRQDLAKLEDLVSRSGGRVLDLAGVEDAATAFGDVLEELRSQYVLGYYPTTRSDDGTWHPVKVRVPGSGLRVRTRRGYIDF